VRQALLAPSQLADNLEDPDNFVHQADEPHRTQAPEEWFGYEVAKLRAAAALKLPRDGRELVARVKIMAIQVTRV
jgi:hypothetical protein